MKNFDQYNAEKPRGSDHVWDGIVDALSELGKVIEENEQDEGYLKRLNDAKQERDRQMEHFLENNYEKTCDGVVSLVDRGEDRIVVKKEIEAASRTFVIITTDGDKIDISKFIRSHYSLILRDDLIEKIKQDLKFISGLRVSFIKKVEDRKVKSCILTKESENNLNKLLSLHRKAS